MSLRAFLKNQRPPRTNPETDPPPRVWELEAASGDSPDDSRRWTVVERFDEPNPEEAQRRAEEDYLAAPSWLPRVNDLARLVLASVGDEALVVYTFQERGEELVAVRVPPVASAWRSSGRGVDDEGGRWAASLGADWTRSLAPYRNAYHPSFWVVVGMNLGFTREVAAAVHEALSLLAPRLAVPHPAWSAGLAMFERHAREGTQYTAEAWNAAVVSLTVESTRLRPLAGVEYAVKSAAYRAMSDALDEVSAEGDLRAVLEKVAEGLAALRREGADAGRPTEQVLSQCRYDLTLLTHRHLPLARVVAVAAGENRVSIRYAFGAAVCRFSVRFRSEDFQADLRSEDPAIRQQARARLASVDANESMPTGERLGQLVANLQQLAVRDIEQGSRMRMGLSSLDVEGVLTVWMTAFDAPSVRRFARLFDDEGRTRPGVPYVEAYGPTFFPEGPDGPAWSADPTVNRAGDLQQWAAWYEQQQRSGFTLRSPRAAVPAARAPR